MAKVDPKAGGGSFPKLTQDDLGGNDIALFTVDGYEERTIPGGGLVRELLLVESPKPLRLNQTQCKYLIEAMGSDDSDDWLGALVPLEKVTKDGPDGKTYDVVWVSAPESWPGIFKEAGVEKLLPKGAQRAVKRVASATTSKRPAATSKRPAVKGLRRGKAKRGK